MDTCPVLEQDNLGLVLAYLHTARQVAFGDYFRNVEVEGEDAAGIVGDVETVDHEGCRWGIDAEEIVELEMEATFDLAVDNHTRRLPGQGC